jgi:nicotinate-nucleotide adenylyltransferase
VRRPCVAVLGGSFDPVHNGHVALGVYFMRLLRADILRLIPAGNPWQKHGLHGSAKDRLAMLQLAFADQGLPIQIDQQEIQRSGATYTIDTVRALRRELGKETSIVFLVGADQLMHLDTWQQWRELFDYVHLCTASRPGFDLNDDQIPSTVSAVLAQRMGTIDQICNQSHGLSYLSQDLAIDISATEIRAKLQCNERPENLVPTRVLDYVEQHNLYKRL